MSYQFCKSTPSILANWSAGHGPEQGICTPVKVACTLCRHKLCEKVVRVLRLSEVELHVWKTAPGISGTLKQSIVCWHQVSATRNGCLRFAEWHKSPYDPVDHVPWLAAGNISYAFLLLVDVNLEVLVATSCHLWGKTCLHAEETVVWPSPWVSLAFSLSPENF